MFAAQLALLLPTFEAPRGEGLSPGVERALVVRLSWLISLRSWTMSETGVRPPIGRARSASPDQSERFAANCGVATTTRMSKSLKYRFFRSSTQSPRA